MPKYVCAFIPNADPDAISAKIGGYCKSIALADPESNGGRFVVIESEYPNLRAELPSLITGAAVMPPIAANKPIGATTAGLLPAKMGMSATSTVADILALYFAKHKSGYFNPDNHY